jgi:hypothetical protein
MSDLDKLFENAPEGAIELRLGRLDAICRWFNASGEAFGSDGWFTPTIKYKTIATRPEQPRKTVEDAVERLKLGGFENRELIAFDSVADVFFGCDRTYNFDEYQYQVCTREEFEACVAAKAKSEPEWTHTYTDYGTEKDCVVVYEEPDDYGMILVMNRRGEYVLSGDVKLKPIKPTITKAEAFDRLEKYNGLDMNGYVKHLREKYTITD